MEGTRSQDSNVDSFLSGQQQVMPGKKQGTGPGEHSSGEGGTKQETNHH